jgi:hypothetical protein
LSIKKQWILFEHTHSAALSKILKPVPVSNRLASWRSTPVQNQQGLLNIAHEHPDPARVGRNKRSALESMEAEWVVAQKGLMGHGVKIFGYPVGLRCANPTYETG